MTNLYIKSVRRWVESFVIEMNLCPFAKRELMKNTIRFASTAATTEEQLLVVLQTELELLNVSAAIETTLLIHPHVLQNFYDYNHFLSIVDELLEKLCLVGVYQIASFHPDYQFAGTAPEDYENYTNRSPYPILHILREASLERAIENYPEVHTIPARNIDLMNRVGGEKLSALMHACFCQNHDAEN